MIVLRLCCKLNKQQSENENGFWVFLFFQLFFRVLLTFIESVTFQQLKADTRTRHSPAQRLQNLPLSLRPPSWCGRSTAWYEFYFCQRLKYCCDRKSRAACAQSFAPWQQATIEIMRRNLSYYCLLALHIWWCYSSRTSRSWWITQSTQRHRRGCNNIKYWKKQAFLKQFHWNIFQWDLISCNCLKQGEASNNSFEWKLFVRNEASSLSTRFVEKLFMANKRFLVQLSSTQTLKSFDKYPTDKCFEMRFAKFP